MIEPAPILFEQYESKNLNEVTNFTDHGPLVAITTGNGSVHYICREHVSRD